MEKCLKYLLLVLPLMASVLFCTKPAFADNPLYSLNSTNSTVAGTPISHNLNWSSSASLSGYTFQFCNGTWNGTNCLNGLLSSPSNVITANNAKLGEEYERKTFYDEASKNFFVFWINITSGDYRVNYQNSSDGVTWSSIMNATPKNYCNSDINFYVFRNGSDVAIVCQSSNKNIYFENGTLSNGAITWGSISTVATHVTYPLARASVTKSSTGVWWVGVDWDAVGSISWKFSVFNSTDGTTWKSSYNSTVLMSGYQGPIVVLPLKAGKIMAIYSDHDHANLYWANWAPETGWSSESSTNLGFPSNAYKTNDLSATVDSSGNVHLVYMNSSNNLYYINYTTTWSGAVTLDTNVVYNYGYPSIGVDNNDNLHVFWNKTNIIYYIKYDNSTSAWSSISTPFGTSFTSPAFIYTAFSSTNKIPVEWLEGTANPYSIKFDYLLNPKIGWVNDTWSSFSGTWSNVTKIVNSTTGIAIAWCVYANDTSNNWNGTSCSSPFTYNTTSTSPDTTPPTYSSNSTNSTLAGTPVLHSLNWTDNTALSGYIFSFDNGTGTLVNDTWRDFENQTGNVIFMDGFESGNFNLWTGQQTFTGGTVGITTSNAHHGVDSTNITVPSHAGGFVQANEYKTLSTTYSQLFMRQYVKWTSGGPTNAQADGIGLGELAAGKNLGDAGVIAIVYNNSGSYVWAVRYKNGTSWYTSISSQPVQQNVWYSVEIKANDTGFTLYVDGSPIIDLAGLSITSSYNTVQTGTIYTDAGTWSWTFYTDDVVVSTFYIGPFNSWSNVTKTINSTFGATIRWCVYANDSSNNWNSTSCSSPFTYTTTSSSDSTPPIYSSNSTNSTVAGTPILHSLNWFDNVALSGYIFQFCNGTWNGTNCLGASLNWADSSCNYRRKLTFSQLFGTENLTNFPILVVLNSTRIDYTKTSTTDIRFYDADNTTLLKKETELWNSAGNSYVWIKVPQVDNNTQDFVWAYYNCSNSNSDDATNVWNSNYVAVWHMSQSSGNIIDSTVNALNSNTPSGISYQQTGKIGKGISQGAANYIQWTDSSLFSPGSGNFTVEAWANSTTSSTTWGIILNDYGASQNALVDLAQVNDKWRSYYRDISSNGFGSTSTGSVQSGSWQYIVGVRNGTNGYIYVDGKQDGSGSNSNIGTITVDDGTYLPGTTYGVTVGTYGFQGYIDELRISNTSRSQSWVNASYLTESDNFITYGSEDAKSLSWINDTWSSFSGTWSNVTKTVNSTTGATIAWCVYANDTSNNWNGTSCSSPFTYTTTGTTFISISISPALTNGIMFGTINPSTNDNPALNNTNGAGGGTAYNITIDSSTTVNVDLYNDASGDLLSGSYIIGIGNVTNQANTTSNTGNNLVAASSVALSTIYSIIGSVCQNLLANSNCWISYWLDSPTSQPPGNYITTYKYCAVQNGTGYSQCG